MGLLPEKSINTWINNLDPALTFEQAVSPSCLQICQGAGCDRFLGGFPALFQRSQSFMSDPEHPSVLSQLSLVSKRTVAGNNLGLVVSQR